MSKYGIWLNPKDHTIIWPEDQEKHVPFHRDIIISSQELRRLQPQAINQKHQNDVRRREEAFDLEDKRRLDRRRSPVQILKHISPDLGRTTQEAPTLQVIQGRSFQQIHVTTFRGCRTSSKTHIS